MTRADAVTPVRHAVLDDVDSPLGGVRLRPSGYGAGGPEPRQRFQQLFFPDGVAFEGNGSVRTAVTAPDFNYLRGTEAGKEGLVDQTGIEPVTS